jgi:hypothetical protein
MLKKIDKQLITKVVSQSVKMSGIELKNTAYTRKEVEEIIREIKICVLDKSAFLLRSL